jgi:hypothetical protein
MMSCRPYRSAKSSARRGQPCSALHRQPRVENTRRGVERIDGGIDAQLGNLTRQNGGCVKVGEGCSRCRVGQVVGGHVNGLHGGDRAFIGRGNTFLQRAHFGGQRRLITHGGRNTAEKRGHFRTGLREAENVIHEEQHVLAFFITEIFGHRQARQGHARTRTRRLVHLAVDQRTLWSPGHPA